MTRGFDMTTVILNRRSLVAAGGSLVATAACGLLLPASLSVRGSYRPEPQG